MKSTAKIIGYGAIGFAWLAVAVVATEFTLRYLDKNEHQLAEPLKGNLVTLNKPLPKILEHNLPGLPPSFDPNPIALEKNLRIWKNLWEEYLPNIYYWAIFEGNTKVVLQTNSQGFMTHEIKPKADSEFRIISIGGSTTLQGLTPAQSYPAYLEQHLKQRYPEKNIKLYNLGVSGTQSSFWLKPERLKQLISYQPDLVIQYNAINDLAWNHFGQYSKDNPIAFKIHSNLLAQKLFPINPERLEPYFQITFTNFLQLKNQLAEHNITYLTGTFHAADPSLFSRHHKILMNSDIDQWGKGIPINYYADYYHIINHYNLKLMDFAEHKNISLMHPGEKVFDPNLFVDVCHLTDEGIQLFAKSIEPHVSQIIEEVLMSD